MKRTKFYPPIEERDTEELIGMAHCTTDYWQDEAKEQAKIELIKREVPMEFQIKLVKRWNAEIALLEQEWEKQLKQNESKKYTLIQQFIIIVISPLILLGKIDYDMTITELKEENFKIKVKQRQFALITGLILYIMTFYVLSKI
jgi:hypothetical protein